MTDHETFLNSVTKFNNEFWNAINIAKRSYYDTHDALIREIEKRDAEIARLKKEAGND